MNVAVVKDDVIVNVIAADAPDNMTTFPIPDGKWIGDLYNDERIDTSLEARVAALEADAEQAVLDRAALTLLLTGEETV